MSKLRLCLKYLMVYGLTLNTSYAGGPLTQATTHQKLSNILKSGHALIQAGAYQGIQGDQQHIDIPTLIGDNFSVSKRRDENALLGVGYYIDGQQQQAFKLSYGLNLFYLAQMKVSGNVTQENLFTNLSYKYNVSHLPLFFIVKSELYTKSPKYNLTIDAGAGPNFMFLHDFKEQAINPASVPDSPFNDTTSIRLAATIGIGVKLNNAFNSLPLECGYRFFYLGNGSFDHNVQVSNSLETGSTYANAAICAVSF